MSIDDKPDIEVLRKRATNAAALMKALANENRLLILCQLLEGELSVGALNEKVELGQSAFSQHLAVLRKDGLVKTRKEAQTVYYSLANNHAEKILTVLYGIFCT